MEFLKLSISELFEDEKKVDGINNMIDSMMDFEQTFNEDL